MGKGKELAPHTNVWGVNSLIFERDVDVHFDMHDERNMKPHQVERRDKIIKIANEKNIPVYSCHHIPGTTYRRYPIEDVVTRFPRAFFSNAICYMLALAIVRGAYKINLFGVNHAKVGIQTDTYKFKDIVSADELDVMDPSAREYVESMWNVPQYKRIPSMEEYINQKPAVDYWIGVAEGLGITVNIYGKNSELCKNHNGTVYGYQITQDEMRKRYAPRNRFGNRKVRNAQPDYIF